MVKLESTTDIIEHPEEGKYYSGETHYYINEKEVAKDTMEKVVDASIRQNESDIGL